MVPLSPAFDPPVLKGLKVHPEDPFQFDFILDKGNSLTQEQLRQESSKLVKYFLASLTVPEEDLWVNLSPYEKDRIIPHSFGMTEMGRDLLAEDYLLKQVTASLIYPEDRVGQKFWKRVYQEAIRKYGTTSIPVSTFNKVWIMPEHAVVYENARAGTAYVLQARLKVMLEQDYMALSRHVPAGRAQRPSSDVNALGSQMVREIIIPELTREVNEDRNFATLRQVYNSLILATWYKRKIRDSILEEVYADKNKVIGVGYHDLSPQFIYRRYLEAFKKGVYDFIREEHDPLTQQIVPRKYFSGGIVGRFDPGTVTYVQRMDNAQLNDGEKEVSVILEGSRADAAMLGLIRALQGALGRNFWERRHQQQTVQGGTAVIKDFWDSHKGYVYSNDALAFTTPDDLEVTVPKSSLRRSDEQEFDVQFLRRRQSLLRVNIKLNEQGVVNFSIIRDMDPATGKPYKLNDTKLAELLLAAVDGFYRTLHGRNIGTFETFYLPTGRDPVVFFQRIFDPSGTENVPVGLVTVFPKRGIRAGDRRVVIFARPDERYWKDLSSRIEGAIRVERTREGIFLHTAYIYPYGILMQLRDALTGWWQERNGNDAEFRQTVVIYVDKSYPNDYARFEQWIRDTLIEDIRRQYFPQRPVSDFHFVVRDMSERYGLWPKGRQSWPDSRQLTGPSGGASPTDRAMSTTVAASAGKSMGFLDADIIEERIAKMLGTDDAQLDRFVLRINGQQIKVTRFKNNAALRVGPFIIVYKHLLTDEQVASLRQYHYFITKDVSLIKQVPGAYGDMEYSPFKGWSVFTIGVLASMVAHQQQIHDTDFIDFGANSGIVAVAAHRLEAGRIIVYERNPSIAQQLEVNLRDNGLPASGFEIHQQDVRDIKILDLWHPAVFVADLPDFGLERWRFRPMAQFFLSRVQHLKVTAYLLRPSPLENILKLMRDHLKMGFVTGGKNNMEAFSTMHGRFGLKATAEAINLWVRNAIDRPKRRVAFTVFAVTPAADMSVPAADRAMTLTPGGIDLTNGGSITVENSNAAVRLRLDPAMIARLQDIKGFTPVIIGISPINDLKGFLGLRDGQAITGA